MYSVSADTVFCFICCVFGKRDSLAAMAFRHGEILVNSWELQGAHRKYEEVASPCREIKMKHHHSLN